MSDDLIVSKLKTAIDSEEFCKSCPTAKRISSENLLGAMALGFSYGINTDRPQGEWIDKGWKGDWQFETDGRGNCWREFECSNCSAVVEKRYPNCPYCLARMKGADDE